MLIYSHGFMSFSREGEYLDKFLASHGYTVVAVNYPLTKTFAPGQPQITDVVNQPGDIRFLIDTVLDRVKDPNDVLYGTIDVQRIAVAGVSLGGLTSTLAAYDRRMRDSRIAAAVSIAGPAFMFSARFFADSPIPFMMIASDTDPIVPYEKNARPILEELPGSILVTLKGAAHAGFAQPAATLMRFVGNPDTVGCRAVREGLKNAAPGVLEALTAPDEGLVVGAIDPPCTGPLPPVAMKAARQHMLTTLAVEAFLDSRFAADAASRDDARRFLLHTFGDENAAEVKVETRSH
jgi:predicted dienelactone hydrolase